MSPVLCSFVYFLIIFQKRLPAPRRTGQFFRVSSTVLPRDLDYLSFFTVFRFYTRIISSLNPKTFNNHPNCVRSRILLIVGVYDCDYSS